MAVVLFDAMYFAGSADLTGQSNKIEFDDSIEEKDVTNWASGGKKEVIAGIESCAVSGGGQWAAGDPSRIDDAKWASRREVEAHTMFPYGATAGDVAYFTKALRTNSTLFDGGVGEVAGWTLAAAGSYPAVRGPILYPPDTAVTGDGNGSSVQHIAVPAGQRLRGVVHLYEYSGFDSVVVTVQSDTVSGFSGSPETRLTFDTFTDVGWDVQHTAIGAHADTWYRVQLNVTGSGSALVVVAIGIA